MIILIKILTECKLDSLSTIPEPPWVELVKAEAVVVGHEVGRGRNVNQGLALWSAVLGVDGGINPCNRFYL